MDVGGVVHDMIRREKDHDGMPVFSSTKSDIELAVSETVGTHIKSYTRQCLTLTFVYCKGVRYSQRELDTVESDAITTHLGMERNTWNENDVSVAIQ